MSDKPRNMSARGFLHRANINAKGPMGFIQAHKEWLQTGEIAPLVSPILAKIEARELMPTPGLEKIKSVVFAHLMLEQAKQAEASMAKAEEKASQGQSSKAWICTIYNQEGEIQTRINKQGEEEDLQKHFDKSSDADRWVDRRLVEGCPDWYGVISHTTLTVKGEPLSTCVLRKDAIARVFRKNAGPVIKQNKPGGAGLGFGVKSKPFHAVFSKGWQV